MGCGGEVRSCLALSESLTMVAASSMVGAIRAKGLCGRCLRWRKVVMAFSLVARHAR